ncbi:hypothetical protein BHE90_009131 [Fusarium euwallaceae]|uniref:Uncharacterized protein n=2 Tax=Fusarium solani species complex TaxID=232080 RepID=A0A3M2SC86_9HYPO|nr:hypothetical protein CDV36_005145 [Fusarium kuroshium]RTE76420.1 hypothetical protein BHE90_009131 [Fusarium euwallaceae]
MAPPRTALSSSSSLLAPRPDLRPTVVTVFSAPPLKPPPTSSEVEPELDPPTPEDLAPAAPDKDRVIPDSEEDEDDLL